MKPTLYWKIILIIIYIIFYISNFNLTILRTIIIFVICFIIIIEIINYFYKKLYIILPVQKLNYVWIIIFLGMLYFISNDKIEKKRIEIIKSEQYKEFTIEDYNKLLSYRYGHTIYGNGTIKKVLYPGMYIVEFYIIDIKNYKNKFSISNLSVFTNKVTKLALSIPIKNYSENCNLEIFFYGKIFFYPIEKKENHSFYSYLLKNQAKFYLKIKEKNIINSRCSNSLNTEIKNKIISIIQSKINHKNSQDLIIGIVLGNSNYLDKEQKDKIKKLGLLHLFAASGLHLGIVFVSIFYPMSKIFGKKHFLSFIVPLPFLWLYLFILDFPFTLMRAFIFISSMAFLTLVHKKFNIYDLLVNSFLIMILVFPLDVINLSTIMSFLAVMGLFFLFNRLQLIFIYENLFPSYNYKQNIKYYTYKFFILQFLITFSASFFLQPLLFYVFKGYSLFSPVYNMVFVPIISLLLPMIFFSIIITFFSDTFINYIWQFIDYIMQIILSLMDIFYNTVLWIYFSHALNIGFIISLIYNIVFLYILFKENNKDFFKIRKVFMVTYVGFQFLYFIIYLYVNYRINIS